VPVILFIKTFLLVSYDKFSQLLKVWKFLREISSMTHSAPKNYKKFRVRAQMEYFSSGKYEYFSSGKYNVYGFLPI